MGITRRDALKKMGAAMGAAALVGCGGNAELDVEETADAGPLPTPNPSPGPADAAPDAAVELTPAQLLAGIDTFVVLCMENRSFDHYLGALRLVEGRMDIDGLTGTESNPGADGKPVLVHKLDTYTPADPPHDWDPVHASYNDGKLDGFVKAHAGAHAADVMGYYTRDQLPITYALADQGAICQRWFSSVLGPTWPNRAYLHGGTSNGKRNNSFVGGPRIWDRLAAAGKTATNYFHDAAWQWGGYTKADVTVKIEKFFEHARAGTLPNFVMIDPQFSSPGNDDHPAHDVRFGQALIASVVSALGASPQWKKCVLVITYDEHGGFYDHVAPPVAYDENGDFQRYGFRVPTLVIGPTVRRGKPVNTVLDHTSVIATLTTRYGLEPLAIRAKRAETIASCIDPAYLDDPQPPPKLPAVQVPIASLHAPNLVADMRTHDELQTAVEAMKLPPEIDRRGEAVEIMRRVLRYGEELGAVQIID